LYTGQQNKTDTKQNKTKQNKTKQNKTDTEKKRNSKGKRGKNDDFFITDDDTHSMPPCMDCSTFPWSFNQEVVSGLFY
jgi:hypothetical protein